VSVGKNYRGASGRGILNSLLFEAKDRKLPSINARILSIVVSLLGVRRMWAPKTLARAIAKDRKKARARPTGHLAKRFHIRQEKIMGQDVFTFSVIGRETARQVLYLHGGGFVLSITEPHWDFIGKIADILDAAVTVPIYPLAPENDVDEMLSVVVPIYTAIIQRSAVPVTVMGDSAGGNLALVLAMIARDKNRPQAAQMVLISPALDFSFSNPAQIEIDKRDPILHLIGLRNLGLMRAGRRDVRDPRISPLFGELRGLPPMALFTGTRDLTNPDARALRDKLAEIGNPPAFFEYPEMMHVWPLFPLAEARHAQHQMAMFVRQHEMDTAAARNGSGRVTAL
jgi:epsilon-lactone hydrolase